MKKSALQIAPPDIDSLIASVRGQKVILDADLARIYHVPTKALNQAVKRNREKFPEDFLFQLTPNEAKEVCNSTPPPASSPASSIPPQIVTGSLRSQIVTSNRGRGGRRYLPYAFTEHGAIMAANVLNSSQAIQMSVFVVRAFVKMRSAFGDTRVLARKLALLEQELKIRLNIHEAAIVDVLQRIMKILDPPPPPPEPPPPEIGFHVKEEAVPYSVTPRPPMRPCTCACCCVWISEFLSQPKMDEPPGEGTEPTRLGNVVGRSPRPGDSGSLIFQTASISKPELRNPGISGAPRGMERWGVRIGILVRQA